MSATHSEPPRGTGDPRLQAPATARNRAPILEVLRRVLPAGLVLELASGTGEHAAWLAPRLAPRVWQPSEPDPRLRASIAAYVEAAAVETLRAPLDLDVCAADWPVAAADAAVCINMLHIAPWAAAEGLMAGVGRLLPGGGVLVLYGPFIRRGVPTVPSNAAFDRQLRAENSDWGLRELEAVEDLAADRDLVLEEVVEMPANNLSLVFHRRG